MASPLNRLRNLGAYLWESAQGLDFTLPDRMYDRRRNDGAMYCATPQPLLDQIFASFDTKTYDRFLDVGCGKGFVLQAAARRGFRRVAGIEYDDTLADICRNNLSRLGLEGRVELVRGDAAAFGRYGDFNCFYFFDPFSGTVMETVTDAIVRQCRGQSVTLIYSRPRHTDPIERTGFFQRFRTIRDPRRDYEVYIYRGSIPAP